MPSLVRGYEAPLTHLDLADSSQEVFRPGSASPSAILYEAAELFERRSPKADEFIRSIRAELVGAVDTCIDAAGREFEVVWQKKLLRVSLAIDVERNIADDVYSQAATFGKTFLDLYNPNDFVQMTQTLRVLNAARYYEIGIPLTYDQCASPLLRLVLCSLIGTQIPSASTITSHRAPHFSLSASPLPSHFNISSPLPCARPQALGAITHLLPLFDFRLVITADSCRRGRRVLGHRREAGRTDRCQLRRCSADGVDDGTDGTRYEAAGA